MIQNNKLISSGIKNHETLTENCTPRISVIRVTIVYKLIALLSLSPNLPYLVIYPIDPFYFLWKNCCRPLFYEIVYIFNEFVQFLLEIACRRLFDRWQFVKHACSCLIFQSSIYFTLTAGIIPICISYKVTLR